MFKTLLKVGIALACPIAGVGMALAGTAAVVGLAGLVYHVVKERITRKNAGRLVRQYLESGNYSEVNVGLTGTVVDVTEKDGDVYVAFEVDGSKVGLRSSQGTTLEAGEKLTI